MKLSTLLQQHITSICTCGGINVTVMVTSCVENMAIYNIELTGITATEAALSLITNMESLKEGLDLGIVILFLERQVNFSQLPIANCNDQNKDISPEILAVISTLSVVIAMVLLLAIFLLIFIIYQR